MRARSGLTRRSERLEGIGGSSLEPKVAGPSILGTGCPDRHVFLFMHSPSLPNTHRRCRPPHPARAGSFVGLYPSRISANETAGAGRQTPTDGVTEIS